VALKRDLSLDGRDGLPSAQNLDLLGGKLELKLLHRRLTRQRLLRLHVRTPFSARPRKDAKRPQQ
jgi:hypothetical protein